MEQTISLSGHGGMKPETVKALKIVAFIFFVAGIIYGDFIAPMINSRLHDFYLENDKMSLYRFLTGLLSVVRTLVPWLCLAFLAPNKPARVIICLYALYPLFLHITASIIDAIPMESPELPESFYTICTIFLELVSIYLLSLLLKNIPFSPAEQSWIMILMLLICRSCIDMVTIDLYLNIGSSGMSEYLYYASVGNYMYVFFIILLSVAYYKLCFSKVFDGTYDKDAKGSYSPFNKYVAGVLIAVAITYGLMYIVLANRLEIMNVL